MGNVTRNMGRWMTRDGVKNVALELAPDEVRIVELKGFKSVTAVAIPWASVASVRVEPPSQVYLTDADGNQYVVEVLKVKPGHLEALFAPYLEPVSDPTATMEP